MPIYNVSVEDFTSNCILLCQLNIVMNLIYKITVSKLFEEEKKLLFLKNRFVAFRNLMGSLNVRYTFFFIYLNI